MAEGAEDDISCSPALMIVEAETRTESALPQCYGNFLRLTVLLTLATTTRSLVLGHSATVSPDAGLSVPGAAAGGRARPCDSRLPQ
eukprot:766333-Hanusia_phi.AAC.3